MNEQKVEKLPRKKYERELAKLHEELVLLQKWIVDTGRKACVVFEGRDGAGKGGTIKAITERVSPRVFHVVALTAPTEREKVGPVTSQAAPARAPHPQETQTCEPIPNKRRKQHEHQPSSLGRVVACSRAGHDWYARS